MKALLLAAVLALAGCASAPPKVEFVSAPPPKLEVPEAPYYPVQGLKKGDSYQVVLQAYVASLNAAIGYAHELQELLKK